MNMSEVFDGGYEEDEEEQKVSVGKLLCDVSKRFNKRRFVMRKMSGIKDVNNVEIGEGDIVRGVAEKYKNLFNQGKGESEVFFDCNKWQPFDYLSDYDGNNFEIIKSAL